jgi:hypothetical protein
MTERFIQKRNRRSARWWLVLIVLTLTWAAMCWLIHWGVSSARL